MSDITEAQCALLTQAAANPEGVIDAPEDAKLTKALIKKGLAISLPIDGGGSRLIITDAGRAAAQPVEEAADVPPIARLEEQPREPQLEENVTDASGDLAATAPGAAAEESATPAPPAAGKSKKAAPSGKLGALVELLKQPDGTTIEAMMAATGWQAHSVRGAMSGSLKKGFGLSISSEKTEAGRIYKSVVAEAV